MSYYESDTAAAEYLLLHFGAPRPFPARCVTECLDARRLPARARALDLGCAVGRSAFELARHCDEVVGIDASRRFISIANRLRKNGSFSCACPVEGDLTVPFRAVVPVNLDRERVRFLVGDAMKLRDGLGVFDVVLMANLIDRLRNPRKCLEQLPALVARGGQLIITSPYTWLEKYTPRKNWLGGFKRSGKSVTTFDALKKILSPDFKLARRRDLPFVIREHARKFQYGVAEATLWIRA